ncbi:hypothetical protein [Caballeronia concitans]|nr:hypothetical protein [Caballeronia concitans]
MNSELLAGWPVIEPPGNAISWSRKRSILQRLHSLEQIHLSYKLMKRQHE